MRRESHVRFCEGAGVQSPRATRLYAPSGPDSTLVELTPHPTQAGVFADDSSPPAIDTIVGHGAVGFGMSGRPPCPSSASVLEPLGHGGHLSVGGGGRDTTALGSPFDQIVDLGSGDIQLWVVGEHLAGPRVTFVYDGQGTLRINDVVVDLLPPGPTVFTDSQLEHLFGNIPRVQELRRSGLTLRGAADAYKSERRAFELTLDRAYSASGIQAVLALLQSSSLVDAVLDSGDDAVRFHYKGELYPGTLMFGKHWFDHVKRSDESARDLVRVVTEAVRVSTHEPVTVYIDHRGDYRREVGPMSDQLRSIYEQVLRTGRTDGLPSSIRPTRLDLLEIIERSRH